MFRGAITQSVRSISSTRAVLKEQDLIQAVFLRKIREYAAKQKAAGGKLVDSNADVERSLDDELHRLATKFHLDVAAVRELPTMFKEPEVESAVGIALEGRKLSELKAEVADEITKYKAEQRAKKAEEEARRMALQQQTSKSDTTAPQPSIA